MEIEEQIEMYVGSSRTLSTCTNVTPETPFRFQPIRRRNGSGVGGTKSRASAHQTFISFCTASLLREIREYEYAMGPYGKVFYERL